MTKISYIHGPKVGQTQSRDIPAKKTPKPFINYGTMTAGEMRLMLMQDQLNILGNYYGDLGGEYQHAQQLITDALFNGLHRRNPSFVGSIPERIAPVLRAIRRSRKDTHPAGKFIVNRPNGIGNGFDPKSGPARIPLIDCDQFKKGFIKTLEYRECVYQNSLIKILNSRLNESSHHILYEYLKNPNQAPSVAATKSVIHRSFVDKIRLITELDRNLLRLWVRNGIMRQNVVQGTEPHSPENSIDFLKKGAKYKGLDSVQGINVEPTTSAAVIFVKGTLVPLIKALSAAIGATLGLISSFPSKDRQLLNQLNSIGTRSGSADPCDFYDPSQGPNEDCLEEEEGSTFLKSSAAPLLLLSAGAGILFFGTKN